MHCKNENKSSKSMSVSLFVFHKKSDTLILKKHSLFDPYCKFKVSSHVSPQNKMTEDLNFSCSGDRAEFPHSSKENG